MKVEDWQEVVAQLEAFAKPFKETLVESAQRRHLVESIAGLLSTLERKTSDGIADLHGQDRKQLQHFIGESPWEPAPLLEVLTRFQILSLHIKFTAPNRLPRAHLRRPEGAGLDSPGQSDPTKLGNAALGQETKRPIEALKGRHHWGGSG